MHQFTNIFTCVDIWIRMHHAHTHADTHINSWGIHYLYLPYFLTPDPQPILFLPTVRCVHTKTPPTCQAKSRQGGWWSTLRWAALDTTFGDDTWWQPASKHVKRAMTWTRWPFGAKKNALKLSETAPKFGVYRKLMPLLPRPYVRPSQHT